MSIDTDTTRNHDPWTAVHERLVAREVDHQIIEHEPTSSADADAKAVGVSAGRVAKTIVAVDRDRSWLAVIPASRRLDLTRLRRRLGASRHLRLATEEEVARRFADFEVGATPPLGRLIGAAEVVDPLLLVHDWIVCPGGDHRHAVSVPVRSFLQVADPDVADICVHVPDGRRHRFTEVPFP